jgi:iron complex outermembrane receptor protein
MNIKRGILTALATALGSAGVTGVAVAQQGAGPTLEEVVVTARRIEESISDAPLAVAVMDADFLQDQGISNMQDVLELTPGADWNMFTKAQPAFTMRGINAGAFGNSSLETAVNLVSDGVPFTKVFMFVGDTFDLQRVEVMRGPQGSTFGRNATIGVVHMVSARPEDEFGAGVNVEAGDLGLGGTNGYITGPLGDTTSGRISWNVRDWDGIMEDRETGESMEFSEQRSLRAQLMFEPSDSFSAWLKFEYQDLNEGATVRTGDLSPSENWLDTRLGAGYLPGSEYFANPDPWLSKQNCPLAGCLVDRQMMFLTAELIWDLGDGVSLTSLSGYQDGEHEAWQDVFGAPVALQDQNVFNDATVFSTELRIDNSASGNAFRWLAGIYLLEDEEFRREENIGNPERPDELGFYNCSSKLFGCAGPSHLVNIGDASTSGYGIFGELSFDLSDQWNLTLGGRYSNDSRDYDYAVEGYGNTAGLAGVGVGEPTTDCFNNLVDVVSTDPRAAGQTCGTEAAPMGFNQFLSRDFDDFTSKVSLSYAINDNNNLYALYSEGFKAGGFQHDARSRPQLLSGLVESETSTNYEIGWKGSYDSVRFAATFFSIEQENAQLNNLINVGTGFTTHVANADGVETTGIEFEATWQATERLQIGGNIASYDAEMVNATQAAALDITTGLLIGEDISGLQPNLVPEGTYTIYADYEISLSNGSTIGLRADLRHRDEAWLRAGGNDRVTMTQDGTRPLFQRPALDKIGAMISWTSASGSTTVELWGRNLDDDYDWINSGPGSPFNYAGGVLQTGETGAPGTVRPRGYSGRQQVGITGRFLF